MLIGAALAAAVAWFVVRRRRRRPAGDAPADASTGSAVAPFATAEPAPVRSRAPALLLAGAVLVGGAATGCSDRRSAATGTGDVCAQVRAIDPGRTIGGGDLGRAVTGTVAAGALDPVPEELAGPVAVIRRALTANPDARLLPGKTLGDDGYPGAYQAAYRLRFSPGLRRAAAAIEAYGVAHCKLAPSGNLELAARDGSDLAVPTPPTLVVDPLRDRPVTFDPEDLRGHRLEDFEIPTMSVEGEPGRFRLEREDPTPPDLSDRRRSTTTVPG